MSKHSPTPWRVDPHSTHGAIIAACKGGDLVALDPGVEGWDESSQQWPANAAHIVHCVNVHDDLVAALESLCSAVESITIGDLVTKEARAALKKAKVTP